MATLIKDKYETWKQECESRFLEMKRNEEEINRIFIDIYDLKDEMTPDVAEKDITVHRIYDTKEDVPESMKGSAYVRTKKDEIVSFLSYAVGCIFGRYSLDVDGLAYAGGEWDASKYKTFQPVADDVLPIIDGEEMERKDIMTYLTAFLEAVYGKETLEANLFFIADALGGKGTPRNVIKDYFLKDFFADHCKAYQKRPIYWLLDSGKKNGFKALIYLHRYTKELPAKIRTDYVHELQEAYATRHQELKDLSDKTSGSEKLKIEKELSTLIGKEDELNKFEEKLHHIADQMISLDLDDGVKANYEKLQDILAKIK